MPSHRYFICILPVEHINGKIAPLATKCPDWDGEHTNPGYMYGYRLRRSNVNRYGIRTQSRNLQANPYTPGEIDNRSTFTAALLAVNEHQQIAADWERMLQDFDRQRDYMTPRGYAVACCRANGGEWLPEWSS